MTEVHPRPAATLLLLRDGPEGIEVFMAERPATAAFGPSALVFPGGAVDEEDGPDNTALPFSDTRRRAAIREAFEESGFLLAHDAVGHSVSAKDASILSEEHRAALNRGERTFAAVLRSVGLEPSIERLIPVSRWTTPAANPRRFDTSFFAVEAPPGQEGLHDGNELVDSFWITGARALSEWEAKQRQMVPVTWAHLRQLAEHRNVAELLAFYRASTPPDVLPTTRKTPEGRVATIPLEAGYGVTDLPAF